MAGVGEEAGEYESDPEEAKLSLKMRRREASDEEEEEEEEEEGDGEERERREKLPRRVDSEGESDGQGAAAVYDDDDEELNTEEEEEGTAEEEEGEYEETEGEVGGEDGQVAEAVAERAVEVEKEVSGDGDSRAVGDVLEVQQEVNRSDQVDEEKKENEPFAVPTAGAFYMHDDRFREYVGGRHRRTRGGRKLWESKDDSKWGHDKFEELTTQERHYEEGRASRGRYRGRGKNQSVDRGYPQGNRPKAYGNNIQNNAPKGVRGRGPRRYQPSSKTSVEAPPTPNKQFGKSAGKTVHASSGRISAPASSVESDPILARKHGFGSSLSSASPPFYPSSSSSKEISLSQKRDAQVGTIRRNVRPSVMDESYSMSQPNAVLRGKNVVDSIGMDKLYIDESNSSVAGKPLTNLQFPPYALSSINPTLSPQVQVQGRGLTPLGQMTQQPTAPQKQVNKVSSSTQLHSIQRHPGQDRIQHSLQASGQQWAQSPGRVSQASSPPKEAPSINSLESGELESPPESSKSKTALVGNGKGSVQGSGRGSFLYGGAQVMGTSGNMGAGHGDQNFPGTPAFLQVMQFGGQHPGGVGVPAVGMAFPGYVAQPQLGLGNSEMTWLPVLAGAAGALGASYCPPYIAVDGAYHTRPSGQSSSLAASSSKENNTNKPSNEWQPSQRSELPNDEFGHRQNKLRRYTEMKFD
ncbi:unnamed protein product [Ilex paraguariensis]|uniref:Btz domain-containing protein n=1 Tax=Ilex paraguariensis TaxID=185542 RepID=A0ABC8TYU1_9AQUA